jgi:uncharacterized membrane protein YfcA
MELELSVWGAAAVVTVTAGFIKGAVGFAMPMIMIAGLGSLMPADLALAALILPTLTSNLYQATRDGLGPAAASARGYWRYMLTVVVFILLSAQAVAIMPPSTMLMLLGCVVSTFCAVQLAGWRPRMRAAARPRAEVAIGALAGAMGGVSGVWGPPTVMYLTAIDAEKRESVRVQGVVYALGSIALTLAHLRSGVLNADTAWLSLALVLPASLGMAAGRRVQDRLDHARFRKVTLLVLSVSGLNLIRRALEG